MGMDKGPIFQQKEKETVQEEGSARREGYEVRGCRKRKL